MPDTCFYASANQATSDSNRVTLKTLLLENKNQSKWYQIALFVFPDGVNAINHTYSVNVHIYLYIHKLMSWINGYLLTFLAITMYMGQYISQWGVKVTYFPREKSHETLIFPFTK